MAPEMIILYKFPRFGEMFTPALKPCMFPTYVYKITSDVEGDKNNHQIQFMKIPRRDYKNSTNNGKEN